MAVELATAYVSIVPSAKGIHSKLREELGGPASRVGDEAGAGFMSNFGSSVLSGMNELGGRIVDGVTRWTKRAAFAGGAIIAGGLVGGLNRVLDTEDARIALGQMGLELADIDRVLSGVDRTFDGTPFANPDGFNISAQLLATGRDLGQVEDDLRNIANVTSQTLEKDLARTSDTFLRIAASGRVYATDLNFLAQQGIPIRNILADALGVTVDRLNDMVSAGEVSFDTMMDAISATERFDGAAQAMGSSTRGAFRNVLTGVSRLGESFLGPLFGQDGYAVQALQAIRNALREATPFADDLGRRFAEWLVPAIGRFADWVTGQLLPALQQGFDWFQENREVIGRVAKAVGTAIGIIAGLATAINLVSRALALTPVGIVLTLVSALVYAWQNSERFREIVTGAFEAVQRVVGPIIEAVVGWVRNLGDLFAGNGQPSRRMTQFRDHINSIWESISHIFSSVFESISASVAGFVDWFGPFWDKWGDDIMAVVGYVWDQVLNIIDTAIGVISGAVDFFLGLLTGDWDKAWNGIKRTFESVWNGIQQFFKNALNVVREVFADRIVKLIAWAKGIPGRLIAAIARFVGDIATWARESVASARRWFEDRVGALVEWYRNLPGRIISAVAGLAVRFASWARGAIADMRLAFTERVQALLSWFGNLPGRILSAVGDLSSRMVEAGRDLIRGFRDGINDMAEEAAGAAASAAVKAVAAAKRALGLQSPSRVFAEIGRDTVAGFVVGVNRDSVRAADATAALARRAEEGARAALVPLTASGIHQLAGEVAPAAAGDLRQDERQRRIARAIEDSQRATVAELRELRAEVAGLVTR